jgi:hypothetical protein
VKLDPELYVVAADGFGFDLAFRLSGLGHGDLLGYAERPRIW